MLLALDVSSSCTGWSLWNDAYHLVDYGSFKPTDLLDFHRNIDRLILRGVRSIVAEDIFKGPSAQTFKVLAGLQAIVRLNALQHGIPLELVSALVWRKSLGWGRLKRKEAKALAVTTVEALWGVKLKDDLAESILLGYSRSLT